MILPSKHVPETQALLGVGAILIEQLRTPQTVTSLWERVRGKIGITSFGHFVLALDMLYITGAVSISGGLIMKEDQ